MSRLFYPEAITADGKLNVSEASNIITVDTGNEFLIHDSIVDTTDYAVGLRQFDMTTGWTSKTVHLRFSLNGTNVNNYTPVANTFYLVADDDANYNPSGSDPLVTTNDDIFIAEIVVSGGDTVSSVTMQTNKSHLVIETIDSITHNAGTVTPGFTYDDTYTLNQGEAGPGVGSGSSGLIIDRGVATANFQILFNETSDLLEIGLEGNMLIVPRFGTAPVDGEIPFIDTSIGDELGHESIFFWDKANNRLGVNIAAPDSTLEVGGEIFQSTDGAALKLGYGNTLEWNIRADGNYKASGSAYKFDQSTNNLILTSYLIGVAGNSLTVSEANVFNIESVNGRIGIHGIPSTIANDNLKLYGNSRIEGAIPTLFVDDTSGTDGFTIRVDGVNNPANPIFSIIDEFLSITRMTIYEIGDVVFNTNIFNVDSASGNTLLRISNSGTGTASLRFDASNGDFLGDDWTEIYQSNALDFYIRTNISAGNIIFQPKNSTGNVGINTATPSYELEVEGKIGSTRADFPEFVLTDTTPGHEWHLYATGSEFHIAEINSATSSNRALTIFNATKNIQFGSDFYWDRVNSRLGLGGDITPSYTLEVKSNTAYQAYVSANGATNSGIIINAVATKNGFLQFSQTDSAEFSIGYNYGGGTDYFEIYNDDVGVTSAALKVYSSTNDIEFDGSTGGRGLYWDVDIDQLIFGTRLAGSDPSFTGFIRLDGDITASSDGGIEFKTDTIGSGHGVRLIATNVSATVDEFSVSHRVNSATWSKTFTVTRNTVPQTIINISNIPTSPTTPTVLGSGDVWNNGGVLTIVT